MYQIYLMVNKFNGKMYVGITKQHILKRFKQHGRDHVTGYAIGGAINKYGLDAFNLAIIDRCGSKEEADKLETFYISDCKSRTHENGYNLTAGGGGTAGVSEETRNRMRESAKRRKHSDETKRKISAISKGRKLSQEHIEKIRSRFLGKKLSAEHIENLRISHIGQIGANKGRKFGPLSDEHRKIISETQKGRVWSEEQKRNHKKAFQSEEVREKLRNAQLGTSKPWARITKPKEVYEKGVHTRWHTQKNIVNPDCKFCIEESKCLTQ